MPRLSGCSPSRRTDGRAGHLAILDAVPPAAWVAVGQSRPRPVQPRPCRRRWQGVLVRPHTLRSPAQGRELFVELPCWLFAGVALAYLGVEFPGYEQQRRQALAVSAERLGAVVGCLLKVSSPCRDDAEGNARF